MRERFTVLSLMLFILFCSAAFAEPTILEDKRTYESEKGDFKVKIEVLENEITNYGTAKFDVDVMNSKNKIDFFGIMFTETDEWKWIRTEPLGYGTTENKLYPAKSSSFEVHMEPKDDIKSGSYIVKSVFKLRISEDTVEVPFDVYIKTSRTAKYTPDIRTTIILDKEVDPRKENTVKLVLENMNARYYGADNIKIVLESDLFWRKEISTGLSPKLSDKTPNVTLEFPLELDAKQEPVEDTITGYFVIDNKTYPLAAYGFEVLDYTGSFKEVAELDKSLFKKSVSATYTNTGNNVKKQLIQVPTGFFSRFFTKTTPPAKVTKEIDGGRYFEWEIELEPGESVTIETVTSYRWFFYLLLIAGFFLILNYVMQSPVEIKKEAHNLETAEGGISEMKVKLHVFNKSTKHIGKLEIIDKVPNIVEVMDEFDVGTLKPNKIVKQQGSTMIKWDVEELDPNEERILTYKIKSKLSILGDFTLPVANIKYYRGKKKVLVYSNNVSVQA